MPTIDPRKLTPHERNTRRHSREQVDQIKKSIMEFGFVRPIVVDEDNVILAGHGAHLAAMELQQEGRLEEVPYHRTKGLTVEQKRAYLLADNRLAELSTWDKDKLVAELADLDKFDFQALSPRLLFEKKATKVNVTLGGARYLLQLEVATEPELRALFEELRGRGVTCKILS